MNGPSRRAFVTAVARLAGDRSYREAFQSVFGQPVSGVSNQQRDRGKFKTPTLREIARRAPYMHDGSLATLEEVVEFYDKGGRPNQNLFPLIRPIGLTPQEKQQFIEFLEALSGTVTGK